MGMRVATMLRREIRHRPGVFVVGAVSVAVAAGAVLGSVAMLRAHDRGTEALLAELGARLDERMAAMEMKTSREMAALEDDMRKITKGLGFNIVILPRDQQLDEVYAEGYASKTMPESYVDRLATGGVVTVNHLLPSLTRKITWEEKGRTVLLLGVRGEVPSTGAARKKPLWEPVPEGQVVLGWELHRSLGLQPGDTVDLLGRSFSVLRCHEERGTTDDITVWMNLAEAQALLGMEGRINAILALECNCESVNRLGDVREEITTILPDTQVIEQGTKALARAEARNAAARTAREQLEAARAVGEREREEAVAQREHLRVQRERMAALATPAVLVVCALWVAVLVSWNARQRDVEIGILSAVGFTSRSVMRLFLWKALLMGLAGGVMGVAAVWAWAAFRGDDTGLVRPWEAVAVVLGSCVLATCAAWAPATASARRDPADILREA